MTGWWVGWSAGSWGTSWGDIPVAETWDTDQGVARNLARNLKFERIEDGVAKPTKAGADSGHYQRIAFGNAYTQTYGDGAYSGFNYARATGQTAANAYAVPCTTGSGSGYGSTTIYANSYASAVGGGVSVGYSGTSATANGFAVPVAVGHFTYPVHTVLASGVLNPSDEELALTAYLLTRKQKSSMVRRNR